MVSKEIKKAIETLKKADNSCFFTHDFIVLHCKNSGHRFHFRP